MQKKGLSWAGTSQVSLKMMIIKSVMFYFRFGGVIRLIGWEQKGINSAGTMDSAEMSIPYGTPQSIDAPEQMATSLTDAEAILSLITSVSSKQKKRKMS